MGDTSYIRRKKRKTPPPPRVTRFIQTRYPPPGTTLACSSGAASTPCYITPSRLDFRCSLISGLIIATSNTPWHCFCCGFVERPASLAPCVFLARPGEALGGGGCRTRYNEKCSTTKRYVFGQPSTRPFQGCPFRDCHSSSFAVAIQALQTRPGGGWYTASSFTEHAR